MAEDVNPRFVQISLLLRESR